MVRNFKKMSRAATVASLDSSEGPEKSPFSFAAPLKRKRNLFNHRSPVLNSISKSTKRKSVGQMSTTKRSTIKLEDQKSGMMTIFPCFYDTEVFTFTNNVCIRKVSIEDDFDCESGDELISSSIRDQHQEIEKSLEKRSN